MSIKINRLEEGHNSYPLVCRRPAETVSPQSPQITPDLDRLMPFKFVINLQVYMAINILKINFGDPFNKLVDPVDYLNQLS